MSDKINIEKPKIINQLVDNSTIKEIAKFLYGNENKNINKTAVVENLLALTHASIVGENVHFIKDGRSNAFLKDENIKTLNKALNKKLSPLKYNKKKEDKTILSEARRDVNEYIENHSDSFKNIFKENINIVTLMSEEIKMYLGEGFNHYWENIIGKNVDIPKPTGLYYRFKLNLNKTYLGEIKSIEEKVDSYYKEFYEELFSKFFKKEFFKEEMIKTEIKEFRWLPLLSHIIRSQYYIIITSKEDVIYTPLNTRKRFSDGLLNTALNSRTNKTQKIDKNKRYQLLYWAFYYLLEKANYDRKSFLEFLTDLTEGTDKDNPIKNISKIIKDLSTYNFMLDGVSKEKFRENIDKRIKYLIEKHSLNLPTSYSEFIIKLSEEEKSRIYTDDDVDNQGIGTVLISDNTRFINSLGPRFNNEFLK